MGRGWLVAVVLHAGCGRLLFEGSHAADAGDDTTDAPAGDASDAPADPCLPSYRVCDTFEAPAFASHWMPTANVTIDATIAHRGGRSVKFHAPPSVPGTDNYAQIRDVVVLTLADPILYP